MSAVKNCQTELLPNQRGPGYLQKTWTPLSHRPLQNFTLVDRVFTAFSPAAVFLSLYAAPGNFRLNPGVQI